MGTESHSIGLGSDILNQVFVQAETNKMADSLCTGESSESHKQDKKRESFFLSARGSLYLCGLVELLLDVHCGICI